MKQDVCPGCGINWMLEDHIHTVFCKCGAAFDASPCPLGPMGTIEPTSPFTSVHITRDTPESILLEAETIVNGKLATDYGDSNENIRDIAEIATLLGQPIDGRGVCRVMMAVKLAREKFNHKRDNLVDLCGYAELLNRWEESR